MQTTSVMSLHTEQGSLATPHLELTTVPYTLSTSTRLATHPLELEEGEPAIFVAAVVLIDHLADLPLRDLEADDVQRILQLRQVNVAVTILVYLWTEKTAG